MNELTPKRLLLQILLLSLCCIVDQVDALTTQGMLARTTKDSTSAHFHDLGRFNEVDPQWEGSSYSYVKPRKESFQSNQQTFEFPNCGSITIEQHTDRVSPNGTTGTGNALWSSALAISEYLDARFSPGANSSTTTMATPTCLELGAGLGLPSFVLARHGFEVLATDHDPDVLKLLEANAEANHMKQHSFAIESLDWAHPQEDLIEHLAPDLIIASDLVWNGTQPLWPDLLSLLNRLRQNRKERREPMVSLAPPTTDPLVLMGYTQRRKDMSIQEEQRFFALLKHHGMQAHILPPNVAPYSDHWPLTVLMELRWKS